MSGMPESSVLEYTKQDASQYLSNWSLQTLARPSCYDEPDVFLSVIYNTITLLVTLCIVFILWIVVKYRQIVFNW